MEARRRDKLVLYSAKTKTTEINLYRVKAAENVTAEHYCNEVTLEKWFPGSGKNLHFNIQRL